MIYITGDLHGDKKRFRSKAMRKLKKNDTLIVCGDFGFLWDGSQKEKRLLKWIGKRRYQVLFVEGTHDNLKLLGQYPVREWNGGDVREISGKLKYLCRGHVFRLESHKFFVFGGGESADSDARTEDASWWRNELPTEDEIRAAGERLDALDNAVDYIVTHQPSRRIKKLLAMNDDDEEANILDTFFDRVRETCTFKRWFFGSLHLNKVVPPAEMSLFTAVVPLTAIRIP